MASWWVWVREAPRHCGRRASTCGWLAVSGFLLRMVGKDSGAKARGRERRAVGAKSPLKRGTTVRGEREVWEVWGRGRGQGTPGGYLGRQYRERCKTATGANREGKRRESRTKAREIPRARTPTDDLLGRGGGCIPMHIGGSLAVASRWGYRA